MSQNNSFDKKVSDCIVKCKLFNNTNNKKTYKSIYETEEDYQNSFDDIISFSKSIPEKNKKSINSIIFNDGNEDGLYSAYIVWLYLNNIKLNSTPKNNLNNNILFVPAKPASSQNKLNYRLPKMESSIKGKNVIILDISYSRPNIEYISKLANNVIIIDDHPLGKKNTEGYTNVQAFVGDDKHSACPYTWKFFNPKLDVPEFVMHIDNNDRKLGLPFLKYADYVRTYTSFMVTHSPYLSGFKSNKDFKKLHNMIGSIHKDYMYLVGRYYFEVSNNIKDQVARNARKVTFQGHPVYVLNYNDPVLYKMVGRQMITNAEKAGDEIHFAVLWGYEYTSSCYKIHLSEKHAGNPKYNLPEMAQKLGRIGGHPKGGRGSKFIGNFYWPHNNKYDIWDLFDKKFI